MPRWFRAVMTGLCFATFSLGTGFISWVVLPITGLRLIGRDRAQRVKGHQRVLVHCYRAFMTVLWLAGVARRFERPVLPDDLPRDSGYIVLANHPTLIDVLAILGSVPNVCCVVHRRYFRSPFVGPLLHFGGHIKGPDPNEPSDGTTVLDGIVERLGQGIPVLVFPEGTRSPMWGLRRFRRGGVEAAVRADVPVLPIFVSCDPPTLMKGDPFWKVPSRRFHLTLSFLPVIYPARAVEDSATITRDLKGRYTELVAGARARAEGHGEAA